MPPPSGQKPIVSACGRVVLAAQPAALAVVPSGPPASFKLDQARRGGLGAAVVAHPPPSASAADAVCRRLTAEVQRKLRLATEAEEKDDRDVICAEVFADVTGELNRSARESTGALYRRWFEVLAPYLCKERAASEALLALCRQLWGQPFTAPTYALLLHQWLLVHSEAGGEEQRLKHLNVLFSGARQLFVGDAETGRTAFQPLYAFILEQVVLSPDRQRLDALPRPARASILALAAAFLPYYCNREEFLVRLGEFPAPQRPPEVTSAHLAGEGADFALDQIVDTISKEIRTEGALLRYLHTLLCLRGRPHLALATTATRVRLQGELYLLSQPGGPRYAPRRVNRLAGEVLDALFPAGRRMRRLIRFGFRVLHPQEWPWYWYDFLSRTAAAVRAWFLTVWAALLALCASVWRPIAQLSSGVRRPRWRRPHRA